MNGFLLRLRLFAKLWCTSIYLPIIMLLIPIVAMILYNSGVYTIETFSSMIYEKAAPLWLIFIFQWCFAVDVDSKFVRVLCTYPMKKSQFLLERWLFSLLIFGGLISIVTVVLMPIGGSVLWNGFVFTIPVYIAMSGFIIFGTMIGNHSLGGLLAGIFFWSFSLLGGALLRDLNVILLVYTNVYHFVTGVGGLPLSENVWILYNRLFYFGFGIFFMTAAILRFNRKNWTE
ncbi:hypothetical protein [Bacillus sp. FJAT-50079]|uniref:hypothetical protein n=1 Tax=Bacillus sp. FJAT-50079 TaxID=2833577 RepID=UPI001BC97063|nr:hypothetical protein [Bacillus sp. FJAT-50079]MBS4209314.1 hypothetical protein [Bacillus sp. FJAT-50079]